jgi:hypothetical protein
MPIVREDDGVLIQAGCVPKHAGLLLFGYIFDSIGGSAGPYRFGRKDAIALAPER